MPPVDGWTFYGSSYSSTYLTFVPVETARRIRDLLLPKAQVVTPNRFEAEVLLDLTRMRDANERVFLDGFAERGPSTAIVTSFVRDAEKRQLVTAFSNGYVYERIISPFHSAFPGYGAGDVLAGGVASMLTAGASPWAATVLATALASLDLLRPLPYLGDDACGAYAERFGVVSTPIPAKDGEGARLKFAPPKSR